MYGNTLISFQGNNKRTLGFLVVPRNKDGYVSFEQVFHCAKDTEIDPELRKCYVELILVMFVDVDDNRPFLDQLCYSFVSVTNNRMSVTINRLSVTINRMNVTINRISVTELILSVCHLLLSKECFVVF